ncbi:MAG TPA: pyridoxal-phosphate dependent enzyme, partial [Myxococcota bacterium]|nr:pyridoxal-phosphate dependent enzyme [Myxococcota bacterium]
DNPFIWEGNGTMIDEIAKTGIKPDVIVLSVGGGGLFIGVVEGLRRNGWSLIPIIAVETKGAESFAESLRQNKIVTLPQITSIAVTLGCKRVAERAFTIAHEHEVHTEVVSDERAVSACLRFADDHRVIVEPACGVSLSLVYDHSPLLEHYNSILVIVCGGAGVSYELLQKWHKKLLQ